MAAASQAPANPRDAAISPGRLFIDGEWRNAEGEARDALIDPSTGEEFASAASASEADVDAAAAAAHRAFEEGVWARSRGSERAALLYRIADLFEARAPEIAHRQAREMGMRVVDFQKGIAPFVASLFRYHAGWATKLDGEVLPVEGGSADDELFAWTAREPLGVVAAITPFNFPISLSCSKIAPALAAGNTIVHKPAHGTPLAANILAEVIQAAGAPPGVYNLVTGSGAKLGRALASDPRIAKIAFTGSTQTGIGVIKQAADTLKHVTAELGGKSANIVLDDVDIGRAVETAFNALYWNKGEVCIAGSRLLVQRRIYDAVVEKLIARVRKARVGDPLESDGDYGPMSSAEAQKSVLASIEKGKSGGARLVAGGGATEVRGRGFYVEPTLFVDADNSMTIAREEIFGPVLTVIPFDDDDEGVAIANDTPFGLAAGVQSGSLARAMRLGRRLRAGMVWLNCWNRFEPSTPFGGYKASGYGREQGREVYNAYTQVKTLWADLGS